MKLSLPTYHNFTKYSYYDVLEQLTLQLIVMDRVKRDREERSNEELKDKMKLDCGVEVQISPQTAE